MQVFKCLEKHSTSIWAIFSHFTCGPTVQRLFFNPFNLPIGLVGTVGRRRPAVFITFSILYILQSSSSPSEFVIVLFRRPRPSLFATVCLGCNLSGFSL